MRPSVLPHPLEQLQAAAVEGGAWQGETLVWASRELPYLATYSPVRARSGALPLLGRTGAAKAVDAWDMPRGLGMARRAQG